MAPIKYLYKYLYSKKYRNSMTMNFIEAVRWFNRESSMVLPMKTNG